MLKDDNEMMLQIKKPENVDENMIKLLKTYFHKKKCAYWVDLASITIMDITTQTPLEPEHYCIIVKPKDKYNIDKDNYNIFEIMKPFLDEKSDFVDFSILGHFKTMQIYDKENVINIFK